MDRQNKYSLFHYPLIMSMLKYWFLTFLTLGDQLAWIQSKKSTLDGKHLVVNGVDSNFAFSLRRNETGQIVRIAGVGGEMLYWLSNFYNFTFSPLQLGKTKMGFDALKDSPGLVTFILNGDCDLVGSVVPTESRAALVDFTHPFIYSPVCTIIPRATVSYNAGAVAKPFQLRAWIGIGGAIIAVITALCFFLWYFRSKKENSTDMLKNLKLITLYILGLLLYQAGHYFNNSNMPSRLVFGTWCLAAFILTNYYTSLLTSYMTAPNPLPLIKSIEELHERPNIHLITEAFHNTDAILSTAKSGMLKELGDMLRAYPKSRCPTIPQCIEMVKAGSHVYVSARDGFQYDAIRDDYLATKTCNLDLLEQEIFNLAPSWTLQKKSLYTAPINEGFMRIREAGLVARWSKEVMADTRPCLGNKKRNDDLDIIAPLSLASLTGAFVVLLIGIGVSLVVYLGEMVRFACGHPKKLVG